MFNSTRALRYTITARHVVFHHKISPKRKCTNATLTRCIMHVYYLRVNWWRQFWKKSAISLGEQVLLLPLNAIFSIPDYKFQTTLKYDSLKKSNIVSWKLVSLDMKLEILFLIACRSKNVNFSLTRRIILIF